MKTYKIEFYVNTKCVHTLHDINIDCKGYSKEDLINYLCNYGYIGLQDANFLLYSMNSWVIEEEK